MRFLILNIFIFNCFFLQAQEQISVLENNPILELKRNKGIEMRLNVPLSLPFLDDFSYNSSFPNNFLWEDSAVFINRSYPLNPVTIGVATFDGINSEGLAYDISASIDGRRADSLTSKPIDLSSVDSVYLLFYYQGKGLGDNPQIEDSLFLEFLNGFDSLGLPIWNHVWSVEGQSQQEFERVEIKIRDTIYLRSDFQFRFRNKATLSGNYDHWHIDYVKLDTYYSGQIPSLEDMSFVYDNPQILRRYREMPWVHFIEDVAGELNDTLDIILRNNQAGASVDYKYDVYEHPDTIIEHFPFPFPINAPVDFTSTRNDTVRDYSMIGNFSFPTPILISDTIFQSESEDSATFKFQNVILTEPNDNKQNDTLIHFQKFNSHFAYDDGIAEFAYGINVQGAKMAYQFKLNKADSLRIVQIYFAQMQNNVSNIPFYLVVWDDNNGIPGNILLKDTVYPIYLDRLEFHNYYLDSIIGLNGTFYVGIEQTTNDMLNIGLDRNSIANQYMLYNVGGGWNFSQFPGAWMIRPVLSSRPIISLNSEVNKEDLIRVFPNPFSNHTTIILNRNTHNRISLFDINGRLINSVNIKEDKYILSRESIDSGMYIIHIQNNKGIFRRKIIIQ